MLKARLPRALAAGTLLAGMQFALTASPATAASATPPHFDLMPSFLASTDAFTPNTTTYFPTGILKVGSSRGQDGRRHTQRLHLGFDTSSVPLARLSRAELVAVEAGANNCAKHRAVKAQATAPFTEANTWRHPPATLGDQVSGVPDTPECASTVRYNLTDQLHQRLRLGMPQLWLKLQVTQPFEYLLAYGRELYGWQFHLDVTLTNTTPGVPTETAMQATNQAITRFCPNDFWFNSPVFLYARLHDADQDPADTLTAEFEYWNEADPTTKILLGDHPSGQDGLPVSAFLVPSADLTDGRYAWHARTFDRRAYSSWTEPCSFNLDRTPPAVPPTVTSPEYPEDAVGLGPLQPGHFTFTANGAEDVVQFAWGTGRSFMPFRVQPDRPGGSATIVHQPFGIGPVALYVASLDRAGNWSEVRQYRFIVRTLSINAIPGVQTPDPSGNATVVQMRFSTQPSNGITTIRYSVDEGPEGSVAIGSNGTVEVFLEPMAAGEHTLRYAGVDAAGAVLSMNQTPFFVEQPSVQR